MAANFLFDNKISGDSQEDSTVGPKNWISTYLFPSSPGLLEKMDVVMSQ